MDIKDGDLISFSGRTLLSSIIKWSTGSDLTHVGLAVWVAADGKRHLCVLESVDVGGVRLHPLWPYVQECEAAGGKTFWQPCRDPKLGERLMANALRRWGQQYPPARCLLATGFSWFRRLYARLFGGPLSFVDSPHCSQLIASALEDEGHELDREPNQATPRYISELDVWKGRTRI